MSESNLKMLSINLWYEMYKNKTDMQMKSFRGLGFDTFAATIVSKNNELLLQVYHATNDSISLVKETKFSGYKEAFKHLFDYCKEEKFDFVYIRRLMSKILFAYPYFKQLSKVAKIVYEIPTYPLDKSFDIKLTARNIIEFSVFNLVEKHISLVPVVLCDRVKVKDKWMPFLNSIDIDNYHVEDVPELTDTINLFVSSNLAPSHAIERLFYAIKNYSGKLKIHVTIVSRDTPSYAKAKEKAKELQITDCITFMSEKTLDEVVSLGSKMHIGVGILTYNEPSRTLDTSLKTKDYCAIGLPFFSSCEDLSFEQPFPYHYIVNNDSFDFDLNDIVEWYLDIRKDPEYKQKMYQYAKDNLQYDKYAKLIVEKLGIL